MSCTLGIAVVVRTTSIFICVLSGSSTAPRNEYRIFLIDLVCFVTCLAVWHCPRALSPLLLPQLTKFVCAFPRLVNYCLSLHGSSASYPNCGSPTSHASLQRCTLSAISPQISGVRPPMLLMDGSTFWALRACVLHNIFIFLSIVVCSSMGSP